MTSPESRTTWRKSGSLVAVYFIFIAFSPTQTLLGRLLPRTWQSGFALNASLYAIPIILMLVFFGRENLGNFRIFRDRPWQKLGQIGLSLVLLLLGNLISGLLVGKQSANQTGVDNATTTTALWAAILLFVILGPLLEETIFRKILLTKLATVIPRWLAIGVSCLGFLLIHVNAPQDLVAYAPLAIIFTGIYLWCGENIAFSWTVHMLNNLVGVLVAFSWL